MIRGAFITAAAAAVVVWFGAPLLAGRLDAASVDQVQMCSLLFLIGMPGYTLTQVIVRKLVLDGRTAVLIPLSAGQLAVNAGLDVLLGKAFGLSGVALATSAMQWLTALALWRLEMPKRVPIEAALAAPVLKEA
jgi:peptidoglycan biosynthesis protein MviN/MurJ (putative lipid II flippase)